MKSILEPMVNIWLVVIIPEIDISLINIADEIFRFLILVGLLNWAVIIGGLYVHYAASPMGIYHIV